MVELLCTYIGAKHKLRSFIVKKIGIIKEIDGLGRLQIPKEIRKRLGLGKTVELVVTEEGLLIKSEEYRLVKVEDRVKPNNG